MHSVCLQDSFDDDMASTALTLNKRGLSEDKRSENALLRSHVDEQSQLIAELKRRSDEAVHTADSLDKRNKLLVVECEKARDQLAVQTRRCDLLESRFNMLASNHQQMIEVSCFILHVSFLSLFIFKI